MPSAVNITAGIWKPVVRKLCRRPVYKTFRTERDAVDELVYGAFTGRAHAEQRRSAIDAPAGACPYSPSLGGKTTMLV
jgi:hypothetical protein